METTIQTHLTGENMLKLFNETDLNIRHYNATNLDDPKNYNPNVVYFYEITIRHAEGEDARELFYAAKEKIMPAKELTKTEARHKDEQEALQNAVDHHNLTGYKVHRHFENDNRKTTGKYYLVNDKGTSLTGECTYDPLNHFIRGYGKAKAEALKIHHEKATKHIHDAIHGGKPVFDADKLNAQIEKVNFNFPNGFTSWHETHFEIVEAITVILLQKEPHGIVEQRQAEQGRGGLYELAQELTDEFENRHIKSDWHELDWYDTIEAFIKEKLYSTDADNVITATVKKDRPNGGRFEFELPLNPNS